MKIKKITEAEIQSMVFPSQEMLSSKEQIEYRSHALSDAQQLSNNDKHKVTIIFRDLLGINMVYTTIWFVSDIHIQLKAGVLMPISSILDVIL